MLRFGNVDIHIKILCLTYKRLVFERENLRKFIYHKIHWMVQLKNLSKRF